MLIIRECFCTLQFVFIMIINNIINNFDIKNGGFETGGRVFPPFANELLFPQVVSSAVCFN